MAEMTGRMNHSQCVPPLAFCLQIPSFQACTEGLPLVLQRPDNFPLVMGILQEINQEKTGFSSCAGTHPRSISTNEVKQENTDVEEHHQSLKSELCEEWSLKGVEELLTESEELQLRHDCGQHAHNPSVSYLEAYPPDEKHLIALQSVHPNCNWNVSEEAYILVEEKPTIHLQNTSSFEEQFLFQENELLAISEKLEVFLTPRPEVDVNSNLVHEVPVQNDAYVEDKESLHRIQAVKREPEELEAQAPTSESFAEQNRSTGFMEGSQLLEKKASTRLGHDVKFKALGSKLQLKRVQSFDPELKPMMDKCRLPMHNAQWRNTCAVVALSADLSAEESICPSVVSKEWEVLAEQGRLPSVTFVAEPADYCKLTLSLASSKSHVASGRPSLSDGNEHKPVGKKFIVQGQHGGQCRRTSPHQWQQTKKRSVSCKHRRHAGKDTMLAGTKKQLFPTTDGCGGKDVENLLDHLGSVDHCNIFLEPKDTQNCAPQLNAGQGTSSNCKADALENKGPRKTLQSMSQTVDERGSPERRELQKTASISGQVTEHSLLGAEGAPQMTESERKKMRGTLPLENIGDVKDTRCHRSDGKSWRCVRECLNGAYYCQYHLQKRRIGYNKRRNRDVNHLEAVSKESLLKSNKKSR